MSNQLPYPGRYESHDSWMRRCDEWKRERNRWNQELNSRQTSSKSGRHGKVEVFHNDKTWGLYAEGNRAINQLKVFFGLTASFSETYAVESGEASFFPRKHFFVEHIKNANGCGGMYGRDDARVCFSGRMELVLFLLTRKGTLAKRLLLEVRR